MRDDFEEDDEDDDYPTVPRVPPRCPQCNANRSRVTGESRDGLVRYHRCQACGKKFKSVEVDPPEIDRAAIEKKN